MGTQKPAGPLFSKYIFLVHFACLYKQIRIVTEDLSNEICSCGPGGGGGVLPYKGLMGTCGQPGYVFRDFCLKQGIEFIIFCLNQGIDLSIFVF